MKIERTVQQSYEENGGKCRVECDFSMILREIWENIAHRLRFLVEKMGIVCWKSSTFAHELTR